MQQLFSLLLYYSHIITFLVLEILSISIYFSRNSTEEKQSFLSSANGLSGAIYEYSSSISNYWQLAIINDSLARENAELRMRLPNSKFSRLINKEKVVDTSYQQQYEYVSARVINNTQGRAHNYLTINKGSKHGIQANTGVMNASSKGLIGIVRAVSPNYSVIMSLYNINLRISTKIKSNNHFGSLVWDGTDSEYMLMESIPKHAKIKNGDSIVTSGYSSIFPENLYIGKVDSFYVIPGSNFYTAKVKLVNSPYNTQYVYVINNLMREERENLEQDFYNE